MKQIDEYLESLYKGDTSEETIELKSEMKYHLIESVKDLQNEGYSQGQAVEIAIDRFHGGSEMVNELDGIINDYKDKEVYFKKKITTIFRNVMIISILFYIFSALYTNNRIDYHYKLLSKVEEDVHTVIGDESISNKESYRNKLDNLLKDKYNDLKKLNIYSNGDLVYDYSKGNSRNTLFLETEDNNKLNNFDGISFELGIGAGLYLILDNLKIVNLFVGLIAFISFTLLRLEVFKPMYLKKGTVS